MDGTSTDGERYLLDRRKQMDRNNYDGGKCCTTVGQKRGNTYDLEQGRKVKKRKFVLVGEQWGSKDQKGNRNLGLDQERDEGTGPLEPVTRQWGAGEEAEKGIPTDKNTESKVETGPLTATTAQEGMVGTKDVVDMNTLSTRRNTTINRGNNSDGRNQERGNGTSPLVIEIDQELEDGTSPLISSVDQVSGCGTSPLMMVNENIQEHEAGTSSVLRGDRDNITLFDTAANVVSLHEGRGDCVVRRGWCQEHCRAARKSTTMKQVWTRSKKTGLYSYRSRKLSVWSCTNGTPTLVGTMGSRDSAGGSSGIVGQGSE